MGHQWAAVDDSPVEQSIHKLHGMFLAVLLDGKEKEDKAGLLFPVDRRKAQQDSYPWHQLQLPNPKVCLTYVPPIGPLPQDWKRGADFLPALLRWLTRADMAATRRGAPAGTQPRVLHRARIGL